MKHLFPIFGLFFLLSSCIKNNPDPVWIQINPWQLESNPNSIEPVGELTHNITDAWVYIDNEFVGIFELPCKVPVLYSGTSTILVYPTILNNGISATKKVYPFMDGFQITGDLIENETFVINPVTRYSTNTRVWIEDFENLGNKIEDDPTSLAQLQTSSDPAILDPAINGNQFAQIQLGPGVDRWIAYTKSAEAMDLPRGQEIYLEIDYHNTNRVTTGILAVSPSGTIDNPNIQMNPQEESEVTWKKIYIEMREVVSGSASGSLFQLSFQALLDEEDTDGVINIDNIKVLHF